MTDTRSDWIGAEKVTCAADVTPEAIERIAFSTRWRGYDADEVDNFLDVVVERLVDLMRALDTARQERHTPATVELPPHEALTGHLTEGLLEANRLAREDGRRAVVANGTLPGVAEHLAWHLREALINDPVKVVDGDGHTDSPQYLTDAEHQAITLLSRVWDLLVQDIVEPDRQQGADLAELVVPLHILQNAVLAQAAARAYPDRYRRLGTSLQAATDD